MMWELADESDRVDDHGLARHLVRDALRSRVERGEQFVDRLRAATRQAVEERRFSGVRVADQRHGVDGGARLALREARPLDVLEVVLQPGDARADDAAV